jgi:hypothetical protein
VRATTKQLSNQLSKQRNNWQAERKCQYDNLPLLGKIHQDKRDAEIAKYVGLASAELGARLAGDWMLFSMIVPVGNKELERSDTKDCR